MSLLMQRAAILSQGGTTAPPVDIGTAWALDTTRRPLGYTLSDDNQTAINTSGGTNYLRWVPTAKAILPTDGRRYWEVHCAPDGAEVFDGYMGVVTAESREAYDADLNPITLGAIGWRGNGTLWSSPTTTAVQQLAGLPGFGAGDVLMFVLDPATGGLWIGRNGIWRDDPVNGAPTWTTSQSLAFFPQIQGRNPGDGGTLRALPAQFSYPVPPGVAPLGFEDPDLRVFEVGIWIDRGGASRFTAARADLFLDRGSTTHLTLARADLFIELDSP